MESKDLTHESYAIIDHRPHRAPLHLDTSKFGRIGLDDPSLSSAVSSPTTSIDTQSPVSPIAHRPRSASGPSDTFILDVSKAPTSGPRRQQRSRSATVSNTSIKGDKNDKEKRKRSRVTPDQLLHLENFFKADRSPTAARRREISELLNMQERQTQIWFQNRRAKAKLQDGKDRRGGSAESPPDTPPELSTSFEVDLHNLIHEDHPVTIIPCNDLTIGSWRRIGSSVGNHELVAYVCDAKRCITWFIQSYGFGFKMEIPFDTIVNTEFQNATPGSGLVIFELSRPPAFYLENVSSPTADGTVVKTWKSCGDWTENHQATTVMQHQLIGSAVQLTHVLRNLRANAPGSDIHLHSPTYHVKAESPPAPMELPPPPLAGLTGPGFQYHEPDHTHSRKRSLSGPPMLSHHSPPDDVSFPSISSESLPHGSLSTSYLSSFAQGPDRLLATRASSTYISPMFSAEPSNTLTHSHTPLNVYSHPQNTVGPRPYSAQPVSRSFHDSDSRILSPVSSYQVVGLRRHSSSSTTLSQAPYDSPSPPLLTTPYHPPPQIMSDHLGDSRSPEDLITSPPMISGLPSVSYEPEDDDLRYLDDVA